MKRLMIALAALALIGCGGGAGGGESSGDSVVIPPVPVVLQSIAIQPGSMSLELDQVLALSAVGTFSDGSQSAVDVAWVSLDVTKVSLDGSQGTSVNATAMKEGAAVIQVITGALMAQITITGTWGVPADPGPVYGNSDGGQISSFTSGGIAPIPVATAGGYGFVMKGSSLYSHDGATICRTDLPSGATTPVGAWNFPADALYGLDQDSAGRLIAVSYDPGTVLRFNPATGLVDPLGTVGVGPRDLAVGADDRVYYCRTFLSVGGAFVEVLGSANPWTVVPASAVAADAGFGIVFPTGLSINRRGEGFIGNVFHNLIYRCIDVNGDGDAVDASEQSIYGSLPGGAWLDYQALGLCATRGGGVLVSVEPGNQSAEAGIYWLIDRNGDGDTNDANERVRHTTATVNNSTDGSCIAAPR